MSKYNKDRASGVVKIVWEFVVINNIMSDLVT